VSGRMVILCVLLALTASACNMSNVKTSYLRTEYLTNPLGIDETKPRLSWVLDADARGVRQTAYQVLVASSEALLSKDTGDLWDSSKVESDQMAQIAYAGKPLVAEQDVFWKVRIWTQDDKPTAWSPAARWRMGLLTSADWKAKWISLPGPAPTPKDLPARPSPVFRKQFEVDKPVERAVVTVTSLGMYELRINGRHVGDRLLTPEWTDYHKRVEYQTYDVTDLLKQGPNAVGATLGDGWYAGRLGISHIVKDGPLRGHYGTKLALLMQMRVYYADGSSDLVATDGSWKVTTDGPIRKACILDGEVYDSRKELKGWDTAGCDDSAWSPVELTGEVKALTVAQPNEPILVTEEIAPAAIAEPKPGVYVVDFGQEVAGWCRVKASGPAGTTVRLRHAEVLDPDGMIYRDNLRMKPLGGELGARQEDEFILDGSGERTFEPHFTYHGFRYVEVTGLPARPSRDFILARVFHSAPPMAGRFECSSPLLNQMMKNIVWTHRDNMHSVPTDCPQRDERMGWMGDMLVFAQPACFNMDMAAFFTKWITDIRDDQADDGRLPDFAPHPYNANALFSGVPAWGDAGVITPWRMYVNYGDKRAIERQFDSCRRWVDWIHSKNPDLLWKNDRNNDYGDWLNGDTLQLQGFPKGEAECPKEVFATAFFQHSAELTAKMARILGKKAEADRYGKLAADIRQAFNKAYVSDDARIKGNTQSAYALALEFKLLPEAKRAPASWHMVERIDAYKKHISTGFHTTVMLMNQLTATGRSDVAYMLINNRTIPSWGYTIDQGATTVWERWDGFVAGRGFQDPAMNSFCHYAIGSVGEWMYRSILGINPDEEHPGYRHFILRPQLGGGLTWAKGSYDSISGRIVSDWKVEGKTFTWKITVPANTTATIYVPATDSTVVTEGGKPAGQAEGVQSAGNSDGAAVFKVASGTYSFVSKLK
jgi:alpha-L-rhamnosidase